MTRPPQTTYGPTGPSWHMETSGNKVVLVNSAFYDDRPKGGHLPSLRLLTVSDVSHKSKLYCYVWYPGIKNPYIARGSLYTINWIRKNPRDIAKHLPSKGFFVEYVISCQLSTNQSFPSHVSVVVDACTTSDVLVPVTVPHKPEHTIDFGVCVAASYGKVDTAIMVEWFELHKILGIKEFNIYNVSMSESMKDVLQYYTSTGDLTLHHMSPIIPKNDDLTAYMNSLPTLNHCFFSNMYRYKHVVIVDFDEFITPKEDRDINYSVLVDTIKQLYHSTNNWTSLVFYNEFFLYDYPPDKDYPKYLPVLQQRLHYATSPAYKYSKSISNPQTCLIVSNHQCVKAFPNVPPWTVVSAKIATSHHYRECDFLQNGKLLDLNAAIPDDTMLRYKVKLENIVQPILKKLHHLNSSIY